MQTPQHGTAVPSLSGMTYTPDASGFSGIDSFTYSITDSAGNRSAATVTIFVAKPGNSAPLSTKLPWQRLSTHTVTLPAGMLTCTIEMNDLLAIAWDADADPLVVYSIDAPEIGRLTAAVGGQVQYARDAGRFGTDTFSYVVADANGGFDTGTIVIKQADSDLDSMPDDWENAHDLDPLIGNAMDDPDQDGLPNLAEYALHTDPQTADNPLNFSALEVNSGYIDVPLNISPEVDPGTPFVVLLDGQEVEPGNAVNVVRNPDGTCYLQLNPVFAYGEHTLALGVRFAGEDWGDNWQTALGSAVTLTVNNPFTLDPLSCTYEGGLVLNATVNIPATSYTIQVRDSQNNPLTTLTGVVTDGVLNVLWDGMDGSGNPIASGPLQVEISFDAAGAGASSQLPETTTLAATGGGASGTAVIRPKDCKCGKDVTRLVYQTLQDIADTYANASGFQRSMAYSSMFGVLSLSSWDILYLFNYESPTPVPRGCEECHDRVTFEGLCVRASELNYIMFGWAIQVTGYPRSLGMVILTDALYYLGDDTEDQWFNKVTFARYGSDLSKPLPRWVGSEICAPVREKMRGKGIQEWQWMGLKWLQ